MDALQERYVALGAVVADDGIPQHFGDLAAEYDAALNHAVLLDRSHEARLRLDGEDRYALLQRISTNDVLHLAADSGRPTIFTNPNGRVIDRVEVYAGENHAILIGGPGLFVSRFTVSDLVPAFVGSGPPPIAAVPGIVPAWSVSDPFAEFDPAPVQMPGGVFEGRRWTRLASEPTGLVNLAKVNGVGDGANTCWARTTIRSDRSRVVAMPFGYSDRAVVYLNGRALYRGDDSYRSRDYRFLGSIGWYDTVFLPLEAGDNDLAIAISEDFGGWGVQARFDDLDGLGLDAAPRSG